MGKNKKLYTIAEASKILELASSQIHYRIRTGQLKAQKLGWFWVIPKSSIEDYLKSEE